MSHFSSRIVSILSAFEYGSRSLGELNLADTGPSVSNIPNNYQLPNPRPVYARAAFVGTFTSTTKAAIPAGVAFTVFRAGVGDNGSDYGWGATSVLTLAETSGAQRGSMIPVGQAVLASGLEVVPDVPYLVPAADATNFPGVDAYGEGSNLKLVGDTFGSVSNNASLGLEVTNGNQSLTFGLGRPDFWPGVSFTGGQGGYLMTEPGRFLRFSVPVIYRNNVQESQLVQVRATVQRAVQLVASAAAAAIGDRIVQPVRISLFGVTLPDVLTPEMIRDLKDAIQSGGYGDAGGKFSARDVDMAADEWNKRSDLAKATGGTPPKLSDVVNQTKGLPASTAVPVDPTKGSGRPW